MSMNSKLGNFLICRAPTEAKRLNDKGPLKALDSELQAAMWKKYFFKKTAIFRP